MKNRNGWTTFWRQRQYVVAGALIVAAAVGMTVLYSRDQEQTRRIREQEIAQESDIGTPDAGEQVAADTETAQEASSVLRPQENTTEQIAEIEKPEEDGTEQTQIAEETDSETVPTAAGTADTAETLHFKAEDGILWPMEGNVIIDYSMDATVYFPTLDQYKYNPAVIIAGDVNSKVYSVAKGRVESIENDEVTGCTVTVSLGDGYEAIYGQLKELNFEVGDYVEAGHVIGYVSEPTKYFSTEGSNLNFEMRKDGEPVDPIEFFE